MKTRATGIKGKKKAAQNNPTKVRGLSAFKRGVRVPFTQIMVGNERCDETDRLNNSTGGSDRGILS